MKKYSWMVAAALLAASCSPQVYPLHLDVRQPSSSGLDLSRKNLSIVYMDGTTSTDSLFDRGVASALARALEADYFDGQEVVPIHRIPSPDSVRLELMHSLVMETEGDVVFLLDSKLGEPALNGNKEVSGAQSADSSYVCNAAVPVNTTLYVYDSMGKDEVKLFKGNASILSQVYNNGIVTEDGLRVMALHGLSKEALEVGNRISSRFVSEWKTESFSFYYFDSFVSEEWYEPLQNAADGKWAAAVDGWAPLVKTGSLQKRACACYNIAQAFYLMGDYNLSSRWLDQAEQLENVSLAAGLRKRLASHLEK